jgi:hypothetical protein
MQILGRFVRKANGNAPSPRRRQPFALSMLRVDQDQLPLSKIELIAGGRQLNLNSPVIMLRMKSGSAPPVGVVRET